MPRELHRLHLALPLGLLGLVGSLLLLDLFGLSEGYRDGAARAPLTFFMPLAGGLLGLALSARAVRSRAWATWVVVFAGTELCAMVVGAIGAKALWQGQLGWGMSSGALAGLGFMPFIAAIALTARRVGRARAGSLLDEVDRMAPWLIIATGVCVAQLPVVYSARVIYRIDPDTSAALGLLAFGAIVIMATMNVRALRSAQTLCVELATMRPRDAGNALPCEEQIDLGIGDEEHEDVGKSQGFRANQRPTRVLRGSADLALPAIKTRADASMVLLAAAMCGLAIPYLQYGSSLGLFRRLL